MVQEVALNWWAVLVATAIPLVVGATWYSPPVFGRAWRRLLGRDPDLDGTKAAILGLSVAVVGAFLLAYVLATTLAFAETANAGEGLLGAFFCWLGFVAATLGVNDAMEHRPKRLTLLNLAFWLVVMLGMGAVLGGWR